MYDEPFADSSQIPTYLVSRMARSEVTVALTGDGGDELFGGYYRHFYAPRLWQQISRVPTGIRAMGSPLSRLPTSFWSKAGGLLPGHGQSNIGAKIQKSLRVSAAARRFDDVYASFLDEWSLEDSPVIDAPGPGPTWELDVAEGALDEIRMMYCDAMSYLPGDILCKVDRAAMAVGLETRVPFLDHRVADVAARIPISLKIANGEGKRIVRPKSGFAIPIGQWLRGPLRDWAEALLDERRLTGEGWFDSAVVRRRWCEHLSGRRESAAAIWAILMFQSWLDEQRAPGAQGGIAPARRTAREVKAAAAQGTAAAAAPLQ
jgi:asparagine synthase (glutamine-hydrolysing)